jgi:ABC-type branched-subunit amino acid transport system substrate-binding protein
MLKALAAFALSILASQASGGTLAICEALTPGDPHLSVRIMRDYQEAAQLAADHFKADFGTQSFQLKWCLETEDPRRLLERAITPDVTAFVGFAFSGEAKVAAQFAAAHRVVYVSPTSGLNELAVPGYGKSLGLPMAQTASIAAEVIRKHWPTAPMHVLYAGDVAYARMEARGLKDALGPIFYDEQAYMQVEEGTLALNRIRTSPLPLVVVAGYAHHHFVTLKRVARAVPGAVFLATGQWAYAQDFLRRVMKDLSNVSLYAISDFAYVADDLGNLAIPKALEGVFKESADRARRFATDHVARFHRTPEAFSYAVYDSVYLSLLTLQTAKDRESYFQGLNQLEWYAGASGPVRIHDGRVTKPGYLLKWEGDRFRPVQIFL